MTFQIYIFALVVKMYQSDTQSAQVTHKEGLRNESYFKTKELLC